MIEIILDDGTRIPLHGKSLLVLPAGSQQNSIITDGRNDWDIIMIVGGVNRIVNLELHAPAIVIVYLGVKTTVNVTGGMALPLSQAVFVAGVDNIVNGVANHHKGRIMLRSGEEFHLSAISEFLRIEIAQ